MSDEPPQRGGGLLSRIQPDLPYVRRYARVIVGGAAEGDAAVRETLEQIAGGDTQLAGALRPRVALYKAVQQTLDRGGWTRLGRQERARVAMVLNTLEGFDDADAAAILAVDKGEITRLVAEAEQNRGEPRQTLILEPEPIIAAELRRIVEDLGHRVVAVLGDSREIDKVPILSGPGLILSETQLEDGSSAGIAAVTNLLRQYPGTPSIFVTAWPEQLLTGERPEPTMLITKPYDIDTLRRAIQQAVLLDDINKATTSADGAGPTSPTELDPVSGNISVQRPEVNAATFARRSRSLHIEVREDTIVAEAQAPDVPFSLASLELLKAHTLSEVRRVATRVELHNHRALTDRLALIDRTLSATLDTISVVVATAQIGAFAVAARRAEREELAGDVAVDVSALASELNSFAKQFTKVQDDLNGGSSLPEIKAEAEQILLTMATSLTNTPNFPMNETLRTAVSDAAGAVVDSHDVEAGNLLYRLVSETLLAIGRWLSARSSGAISQGEKFLEKKLGEGAVLALSSIPLVALEVLAAIYPAQFPWVTAFNAMIRGLVVKGS